VAVAWMRENGSIPCTYTADIGQYDEPDIKGVVGRAKDYGAELARFIDAKNPLVEEGFVALQTDAFNVRSAGKTYFNTNPLCRAMIRTLIVSDFIDIGLDIV